MRGFLWCIIQVFFFLTRKAWFFKRYLSGFNWYVNCDCSSQKPSLFNRSVSFAKKTLKIFHFFLKKRSSLIWSDKVDTSFFPNFMYNYVVISRVFFQIFLLFPSKTMMTSAFWPIYRVESSNTDVISWCWNHVKLPYLVNCEIFSDKMGFSKIRSYIYKYVPILNFL